MECSYNTMLFRNCSAISQGIDCDQLFGNGVCDRACNSEECLYDGFDCGEPVAECNPMYDSYCSHHYTDSHCDRGCNNVECGWDGLDCDAEADVVDHQLADGTLVFIVLVSPAEFRDVMSRFLRKVGLLLNSVPKIQHDDHGDQMIYPWYGNDKSSADIINVSSNSSRVRRTAEADSSAIG